MSDAASGEQTRRARRAQRAALVFQEQCQQQRAEDVARQERAQVGSVAATTSSLSSDQGARICAARPAIAVHTVASTTNTARGGKTPPIDSANRGPTPGMLPECKRSLAPASSTKYFSDINTGPRPNFHSANIHTQKSLTLSTTTTTTTTTTSAITIKSTDPNVNSTASSDSGPSAKPATMASAKVHDCLTGSDGSDGDESDDSDFIMTRTAGKRRGNLSAADMLANEILDDMNEDLNAAAEVEEESDPVKRMHRGYMNEAVAMVRDTPLLFVFQTPVYIYMYINHTVVSP